VMRKENNFSVTKRWGVEDGSNETLRGTVEPAKKFSRGTGELVCKFRENSIKTEEGLCRKNGGNCRQRPIGHSCQRRMQKRQASMMRAWEEHQAKERY